MTVSVRSDGPSGHRSRCISSALLAAPLLALVCSFGGDGPPPSMIGLHVLVPAVPVAQAYSPRALGPGGAFRPPPGSGSSAQGGRGTGDRYGNAASDVITGQGAAANPYEDGRRRQPQPQQQQQAQQRPQQQHDSMNKPVISGERASMASRYSNSFSAFGDTVGQQGAAAPLHPAHLERPHDDEEEETLGETTTTAAAAAAAATTNMSAIRVVTRRGGVQKPPGYVGKKKKRNTNEPPKSVTNQQQPDGKADNWPAAATTTNKATPTKPAPPESVSLTKDVPRPVVSGERASMASRYANSFSPYGSTAPAPEGPVQSSRARQLVGQMLTSPVASATSAATGAAGRGTGRPGGAGAGSAAGAADGMRPVISGDRASMDNRYSNSLSAFGDTAPAPPTIVQQQRAAKRSSAMTPRAGNAATTAPPPPPPIAPAASASASASGGKARVVKKSETPPLPPPQMQQPKQLSAVENPNRPVISGDRASLDNRYSNSFSPFTNEAVSAKPVGGGGRKPTDGPFPSVVRPPPMPKADMAPLPASSSGRAEAKKRKPMIIPRAGAPQTESRNDNELDDAIEEEETAPEKPTPSNASTGSVTHNGDRAGNRNQNSFSAFGDTPVAPVIGGARTYDRYGNSFDSSGNVKPPASDVALSSPSKTRPPPPAAVMNGDRAGGRNQNSFSAFGDTPAPGSTKTKVELGTDDESTPPIEASPPKTTVVETKPEKAVDKKPQPEAPKAILGGSRVEDIYGNSLSAFGDVDLTKTKPRRKPAARFASPKPQADKKKETGSEKATSSNDISKKEVPKAVMNGARADDIYFNSFSAFGADVTKTPKAPRQASRPAKRVPAAYTGNPDITVSQDSGISGSSASNEHDRYGNAHHVYNSHVHALKHQEPIEDDEDGGIITKKERKWMIP